MRPNPCVAQSSLRGLHHLHGSRNAMHTTFYKRWKQCAKLRPVDRSARSWLIVCGADCNGRAWECIYVANTQQPLLTVHLTTFTCIVEFSNAALSLGNHSPVPHDGVKTHLEVDHDFHRRRKCKRHTEHGQHHGMDTKSAGQAYCPWPNLRCLRHISRHDDLDSDTTGRSTC